ncbi:hypothetical protein Tsubulata_048392 [Turnera subulata]|uniref:RING-type domain-containing protein n=1 Tax=Turnera subulata TaxID=218843 RepID=A0A9Q0JHN9_9ROSI|nr:hypothetical protein Tsubulata_048392 [Turnera subulata]
MKGEMVIGLPCSHSFHTHCIMTWFEDKDTCPLCRSILSTDNWWVQSPGSVQISSPSPARNLSSSINFWKKLRLAFSWPHH